MFNVRMIKMQSLNIKEWQLLELQITQPRHPLGIFCEYVLIQDPHYEK